MGVLPVVSQKANVAHNWRWVHDTIDASRADLFWSSRPWTTVGPLEKMWVRICKNLVQGQVSLGTPVPGGPMAADNLVSLQVL